MTPEKIDAFSQLYQVSLKHHGTALYRQYTQINPNLKLPIPNLNANAKTNHNANPNVTYTDWTCICMFAGPIIFWGDRFKS